MEKRVSYLTWSPPKVVDFHVVWIHEDDSVETTDRKIYVDHESSTEMDVFLLYRDLMRAAGFHYHYHWAYERPKYNVEWGYASGIVTKIKYNTGKFKGAFNHHA